MAIYPLSKTEVRTLDELEGKEKNKYIDTLLEKHGIEHGKAWQMKTRSSLLHASGEIRTGRNMGRPSK